jgi:hypothetical protein
MAIAHLSFEVRPFERLDSTFAVGEKKAVGYHNRGAN